MLASENESLLIWWDSFLILNLCLNVLNCIRWLDIESDSLASKGLDKDLHTSTESEYQMEGALLLNVIVLESAAIFELLACEDESLLVWWDSFFVLDLGLDIFNGVRGLNVQCDSLASQCFDEDLHFGFEYLDYFELLSRPFIGVNCD